MKKLFLYTIALLFVLVSCKKEYGELGRPKGNGEISAEQVYNAWCAKTNKCIPNEKVVHTINVSDYAFTKKVTRKYIYERRRDAMYAVMIHGSSQAIRDDAKKYWQAYSDRIADIVNNDSVAKAKGTYKEFSDYNPLLVYSSMIEYTYYVEKTAYKDKFYALINKDIEFVDISVEFPDLTELAAFDAMVPQIGEDSVLYEEYLKIKK